VNILEENYKNLSKIDYNELLQIQKKASEFLKYVNSQYEIIKKMEEENS